MTTQTTASVIYPDSDGMPLPDGEYQAPQYRRIVGDLDYHYRDVSGVNVNGNTFLYYIEGNPRVFVSPDCYVALNLSEESLESIRRANVYLLWEVGKPPDFVMEIGSPSTAQNDLRASATCMPSWECASTGASTLRAGSITGSRSLGSGWSRASMCGWRCIMRMTGVCGDTAKL